MALHVNAAYIEPDWQEFYVHHDSVNDDPFQPVRLTTLTGSERSGIIFLTPFSYRELAGAIQHARGKTITVFADQRAIVWDDER